MGALRHLHLAPDLGHERIERSIGQGVANRLRRVIGEEDPIEVLAIEALVTRARCASYAPGSTTR